MANILEAQRGVGCNWEKFVRREEPNFIGAYENLKWAVEEI